MQKTAANKILSLTLSLSLLLPNISFAGISSAKKTQEEIKVAITAPEKHIKSSAVEYIAWSMGVIAAGAIGYKAGHFIGDIKGFGRGFNAAGGFAAGELAEKQRVAIVKLENEVLKLQAQILNIKTASTAEDNVIRLIVRLNSQLAALKQRRSKQDVTALKSAIEKTIHEISIAQVKDPSTKRILSKFVTQAEKSLSKKNIIMALASIFASVAIAVVVSGEEEGHSISSARVTVGRQLSQAFDAGPQVFTLKVLYLKQVYGLELVSSVIYENQTKYYPALESQLAHFNSEENRLMADFLTKELSSSAPAQHKSSLLDNIKTAKPLKYEPLF